MRFVLVNAERDSSVRGDGKRRAVETLGYGAMRLSPSPPARQAAVANRRDMDLLRIEKKRYWRIGDREVALGERSLIVGILNVTPDSFSDGGELESPEAACERGCALLAQGAALLDIGGESTRPGFEPVVADEERRRVVPVIEGLVARRPACLLSVDTSKAEVARAALAAGAKVVNDVWGFQGDAQLAEVVAESGAGCVLMRNGRGAAEGGGILDRVRRSWERSLKVAEEAGLDAASIALDPGIGFGTTRQEDLELLRGLEVLRAFGFPLMLGASRKRITAEPDGLPLDQRLESTLATTVAGVVAGIDLFRVHDVAENVRAAGMADLIYRGGSLHG